MPSLAGAAFTDNISITSYEPNFTKHTTAPDIIAEGIMNRATYSREEPVCLDDCALPPRPKDVLGLT